MDNDDAEENPSLRQRFGDKFWRKFQKQTKAQEQAALYSKAIRHFRPRKGERGGIVLLAATTKLGRKIGERVPKNYRGKVFSFYVTKTGKAQPYRDRVITKSGARRARTRSPVAHTVKAIDPWNFIAKSAQKAAQRTLFVKGDRMVRPVTIAVRKGNVRWHEDVVPAATDAMMRLAQRATGGKGVGNLPMMATVEAVVELPDGKLVTLKQEVNFGQRREQGMKEADFYRPFFERKVYAAFADDLQRLGMVSQGSAKHVKKLKENRGKPRELWRHKGLPWKKRNLPEARVASVTITPALIRITNKLEK